MVVGKGMENKDWMRELISYLHLLNRTIVSSDNYKAYDKISEYIPLKLHKYKSGEDYSTWIIPEKWDVKEAYLSDGENIIASYTDHPLFLAPYSISVDKWVTADELAAHTLAGEKNPDKFLYQHRLALNYKMRLKDWGITLPYEIYSSLNKDKYYVKIDVEVGSGELIVGESEVKGESGFTIAFLSHLCHPGQVNDGVSGIVAGIELMNRISAMKGLKYNYRFLIMPETYGSAVYLSANEDKLGEYLSVFFIEMAGAGNKLAINNSRRGDTYWDILLEYVVKLKNGDYNKYKFHRGMGNDELNFDWPAIGIPGLAIYWDEFKEYHTSGDSPDIIDTGKIFHIADILEYMVRIIEADYIPVYTQKVPIYQSRYDLYVDAFKYREKYHQITDILFAIDGKHSLFEIVNGIGADFFDAYDYLEQYVELGFLKKGGLTEKLAEIRK